MNPQLVNPIPAPAPNPFADLSVKASGADPIPQGVYFAFFRGVEPFANEKVQGKLRWQWEVVSGPQKGRMATALTDANITPQTHSGRLISGLVQRPLIPGEDMANLWNDLQKAVGVRWAVTVSPGPKGGKPSVQQVSLPPEQQRQTPTPTAVNP